MKTLKKSIQAVALLALLTCAVRAGEIGNPPVQPTCDPILQVCPEDDTQSAPADESDAEADSASADIVTILLNLTLGLLG